MDAPFSRRDCPVCGNSGGREVRRAHVDLARLDSYAFASRKFPEYMNHRFVECPICDVHYADPVLSLDGLDAAYDLAAFDSKDEAVCASRTYAGLVRSLRPRLPRVEAALDIGTGEGSFLERLLELGFDRVHGYEPSAAPREAASPAVRDFIVHDVFRAGGPGGEPFDLVTCLQTIEHVPEPAGLCRDALDLLRPGGALLIVCHDRRAPLNRALGRLSPIVDIEHLQLFSPASARALLEGAGFEDVEVRHIRNRYPLYYWLKLAPLPRRAKRTLVARAQRSALGRLSLSLPVGNLAVVGVRPA